MDYVTRFDILIPFQLVAFSEGAPNLNGGAALDLWYTHDKKRIRFVIDCIFNSARVGLSPFRTVDGM